MKKITLFIMAILLAFALTGCTQQQESTPTPAPTPVPTVTPEPTPAPSAAPEAPQVSSITLGEGEQAISEEEIPAYDTASDKELEEMIKEVES